STILLALHPIDLPGVSGFIGFQHLADAFVDFYAVAIERNVTAGHHHTRASTRNGICDQRGRGNLAGIFHLATRVDYRLSAGAHDAVGAWPEVAGDNHGAARTNIANAEQIPERTFDIDIGLEVGDVFDQAAQSAGAKGQRNRHVIKKRSRGVYSRFGHWSQMTCANEAEINNLLQTTRQ